MKNVLNIFCVDDPVMVDFRKGVASPLNQSWDVFLPSNICEVDRWRVVDVFTQVKNNLKEGQLLSSVFVSDGNYHEYSAYEVGNYLDTLPLTENARISMPYNFVKLEVEWDEED